jgi:hypothetical protein
LLWGLRHTSQFADEEEEEDIGKGSDMVSRLGRWFRAFIP